MWGNVMVKRNVNDDSLQDLATITTLNGEDIMDIILSDREDDYVWEWRERISEEIRTRIATGIYTPIRALPWCVRGVGWFAISQEETPL